MKLLDLDPAGRGLAVWNGGAWRFGAEALAACRVDPQATCWDVWEALSLIPLGVNRDGVRHRADLAVRMLREEGGGLDEARVALTPSGWDKETMRVFLGVATAAGLNVRWLTPRAGVVVSRQEPAGDRCTVVEWSWNRLQQVKWVRKGETWRQEEMCMVADAGILACFRREALAVQDLALEKFRFDPLYSGRTEQALFSGWWTSLREGAEWSVTTPEGGRIDLSGERSRFAALHGAVTAEMSDAEDVIAPMAFLRLMGWCRAGAARPVSGVEVEVEDHDAESARWRETLGVAERDGGPRATHVVIDGIAEPWPGEARPGETVKLPDGRTALAVYVRESHGAA